MPSEKPDRCPYCETPYAEGYEGECSCPLAVAAKYAAEAKRLRAVLEANGITVTAEKGS